MEEKFKEAQRKIDRIPAKSPLQENIKAALQEVLNLVKLLSKPMYIVDGDKVSLKDLEPGKIAKMIKPKSKTPVISPPPSPELNLGPDPRGGEGKSELNFDLES